MDKQSCCSQSKSEKPKASCCSSESDVGPNSNASDDVINGDDAKATPAASCCETKKGRPDYMLWFSLAGVAFGYICFLVIRSITPEWSQSTAGHFAHSIYDLINTMAWGAALGILMVAFLAKVPRELVMSLLGTHGGMQGMLRATGAGLLLDLCSHGILMVGAKLYERGATTGQVMAFLIASPWNSFSLTLILVAMIGLSWTLTFIVLSALVAIITGLVFDALVARGTLPKNPNTTELPEGFQFWPTALEALKQINLSHRSLGQFVLDGIKESRMVLRWLLFGVLLAALIRTFVPADYFGTYFGPTVLGLGVTLVVATILEVCSEGSTPIAADIFNRALAPGNSFAFLMTGVSTDYTEIMVLKDVTRSWKLALFLPLITVPQVVVLAFILNGV